MVEFALVAPTVLMFILGIMQIAWIIWTNNLLSVSVDAAARCGAVSTSTTLPCYGGTTANMIQTANLVFHPLSGATFTANAACVADGGVGLVGTYQINAIPFVGGSKYFDKMSLTLTAKSCYPV